MFEHLPASGHRRVPWRNGGGVTDEILVVPHPADPSRFAWRLSMAQVASAGPFSSFPGVDRTLLLVEGAGMELRFGEGPWRVLDRCFAPIGFRGETPVDCRLIDGPVLDFNVMVDRAIGQAMVTVLEVGGASRSALPEVARGIWGDAAAIQRAVVNLRGRIAVSHPEGAAVLERFDAFRWEGGQAVQIDQQAASVAVVVDVVLR